jgi:hypothetical protein
MATEKKLSIQLDGSRVGVNESATHVLAKESTIEVLLSN